MTFKNLKDAELMQMIMKGEDEALGELYVRYGNDIQRFLYRVTSDFSAAEDLCQEVFLFVFAKAYGYVEKGSLKSWLIGIATNKARNFNRKKWVREKLLRKNRSIIMPQKDEDNSSPEIEVLRLAFMKLPYKYREILTLQVSEGLSGDEISGVLSINHDAVRVRLHRGRKLLQKLIEAELQSGEIS